MWLLVMETTRGGAAQASSMRSPTAWEISGAFLERPETGLGIDAMNGKKPEQTVTLMESKLVTRDNVKDYKGWTSPR